MGWLLALAVGAVTGVLSAFGVGGGSLLLVYLTAFAGVEQTTAQGINLLYFLPAAAMALPAHWKNGYLDWTAARPAIAAGLFAAALGAWVATGVDVSLLQKGFGVFLLAVGCKELFSKP